MTSGLTALCVLLAPAFAVAASGGAHHEGGIPSAVWYQFVNFGLFVALLAFVLRKPIRTFFTSREQGFKQALVKAESAKREAEAKRREIQERLSKLESTSQNAIAEARAEAEALKAKIIRDAEELTRNMKEDTRRTAEIEIERAKAELRQELLSQSVAMARQMLNDKINEPDQKRLQTEFVDKIQVVR